MLDAAIVRSVEAVIHARCEPQRDVTAIAIGLGQRVVAQQLGQFIMRALDLIERGSANRAVGADDCIARADENIRILVNRPCARL